MAFETGIQKHIPSKVSKTKDNLPAIDKLIKRRDRAYKKIKKAQHNFEYSTKNYQNLGQKFKELKKEMQTKMRRAFWSYIETIITPMDSDIPYSGMKCFWSFIKRIRKDYTGVGTLKKNRQSFTDPKQKANVLNGQFESVFTRETPLKPDMITPQSHFQPMEDIDITKTGVRTMLERLKVDKADEIRPCVLKELADVMTDTYQSDLYIIEHGYIHQHLLIQRLHFQKKSCQSCLHLAFCTHPTAA